MATPLHKSATALQQLGLDRLRGASAVEVERVLAVTNECAVWCEQKANLSNPESSLRSEALKPELIIGSDISNYEWDYGIQDTAAVIRGLCEKRSNLLGTKLIPDQSQLVQRGRFIAFWPAETLQDGAACQATHGYFDVSNIPPWDTWVYYGTLDNAPALIAWGPLAFIDPVSEGLWMNPEECIRWLRNDLQFANYHRHSTISAQS